MAASTSAKVKTVLLSAPLGGAVLTAERVPGPSTDDCWTYAPRQDRPAGTQFGFMTYDSAPEVRINYV